MNVVIEPEAARSFFTGEYFFSKCRYSIIAVQGESQKGRVTRIRKGTNDREVNNPWRSNTGEKDEGRWDCIPVKRSKYEANFVVEKKPFTSSFQTAYVERADGATPQAADPLPPSATCSEDR